MTNLREKMFLEFEEKTVFEHAKKYAFDYVDNALQRNVYPSDEAIDNLDKFVEDMPD